MLKRYAAIPFAVMCLGAQLANAEEVKSLSSVVITATKTEQDSFDLPMSIDKVSKEQIQDGNLRMTLSESLARVPGITAQNRTQMAQDPQISSRGFGARSSFGVRGIRVYVDGIPLSMPDGIGNPGSVDLGMIDSIEVMRGPFSAMYGNSSGGVIQMLTGKAEGPAQVEADVLYGSYKTRRESVSVSGGNKDFDYQLSTSDFASDGYRLHSSSDKQQATAKIGVKISDDTKLTTLLNWFQQFAEDPGGMIRGPATTANPSAFTTPDLAIKGALLANARVNRNNTQIGLNLDHKLNSENSIGAMFYAGHRDNFGYISKPDFSLVGDNIYKVGSLSSISRDFYGTDLKWTTKGKFISEPFTMVVGLNYGTMTDGRMDRSTNSGELINPIVFNRNETQKASNNDQYIQGIWSFNPKWDLHGGLRNSNVTISLADKPSTPSHTSTGNLDLNFSKLLPVAGLVYKANPTVNVYGNIGSGFETPALAEVTYVDKTDSTLGPNKTIKPSTSTNYEAGIKLIASENVTTNFAIFSVKTKDEIVIKDQNNYTVYTNYAGTTSRTGLEYSVDAKLPMGFSAFLTYTYLDAVFDTSSTDGKYKAGNRIPGTYKQQAFAELAWTYPRFGFQTAVNAIHNSDVQINDLNTDKAPEFTVFNLRASLNQKTGSWTTTEYVTLNNFTDVKYIGSVKVNDSKSRFFEPAAPANWIIGVKAGYKF